MVIAVFLCVFFIGYSQSPENKFVELYGFILDGEDTTGVSFASIVYGEGRGVSADARGFFRVVVPNGTVIKISRLGYKQKEIKVKTEKDIVFVNIYLEKDPVTLKEVVVLPWNSYEEFIADVGKASAYSTIRHRYGYVTGAVREPTEYYADIVRIHNWYEMTRGLYPTIPIFSTSTWRELKKITGVKEK